MALLARVCGAGRCTVVMLIGAIVTIGLSLTFHSYAYQYLPSAAPTVTAACASVTLAAIFLALPRLDALEVTAGRSLRPLRAVLAVAVLAYAGILSAISALALRQAWLFGPLLRDTLVIAGAALGACVVVERVAVAAALIAYIAGCSFGSAGRADWDLLYLMPGPAATTTAISIALLGLGLFVEYGGKAASPTETVD